MVAGLDVRCCVASHGCSVAHSRCSLGSTSHQPHPSCVQPPTPSWHPCADGRAVARYYLSNDFWLDLIATVPSIVQVIILAAGIGVRLLQLVLKLPMQSCSEALLAPATEPSPIGSVFRGRGRAGAWYAACCCTVDMSLQPAPADLVLPASPPT